MRLDELNTDALSKVFEHVALPFAIKLVVMQDSHTNTADR